MTGAGGAPASHCEEGIATGPAVFSRLEVMDLSDIQTTRVQVVEAGKAMLNSNLVVGTWGNLSARVPGTSFVAITPSGMPYDETKPEDIVIMDLDGHVVDGKRKPSTEVPLHLAIYRGRPEIGAIVHTHSTWATALACAHKEIPPVVEELVQIVGGGVRVAKYSLPGTPELGQYALEAAEGRNAVLLANHGVLGFAGTLSEALKICMVVEKAAQITLLGSLAGGLKLLSQHDIDVMRSYYLNQYGQRNS